MATRSAQIGSAHSTIELGTLLRQYQLELVLITGAGDGARTEETLGLPIQWVHSSDMLDPTPFLTRRTVLLTTGTQFSEDPTRAEAEAYVGRLRRAGVTALGFGVGIAWQRIPPHLVAACEELSLPLFRVPYDTPFLAIVQTAARLLNAHTHARDLWALDSQRSVANAALQRDGLAAVIREASGRLGRWVAVADRTGRVIAFAPRTARTGLGADWVRREVRELVERGTRSTRVRPHGDESVELQTLGPSGRLLGVLLSPSGADDHAERTLIGLVAALATVQLEHRAGRGAAETSLRTAVLRLLLGDEAELAEEVAAGMLPRLPRGQVAVVRLGPIEMLDRRLVDDLRSLAGGAGLLTAPLDEGSVLVCEALQLPAVRRVIAEHGAPAGVSERGAMTELGSLLEQADTAYAQALAAVREGQTGQTSEPVVYRPSMHGGVLRLLQADPEAKRLAESLLAPVRQHDLRHGDAIEQSLVVWLAHHGQTSPAAAELGVHRHTLRGRVRTAASLLQRDLDDPDARAELWAALRLAR